MFFAQRPMQTRLSNIETIVKNKLLKNAGTLPPNKHPWYLFSSEAALQRCSYKKVFLKYAANLQENTHAKVRFQ